MKKHKAIPGFSCVRMMHEGASSLKKELGGMDIGQQAKFWEKRTALLRNKEKSAKNKKEPVPV